MKLGTEADLGYVYSVRTLYAADFVKIPTKFLETFLEVPDCMYAILNAFDCALSA